MRLTDNDVSRGKRTGSEISLGGRSIRVRAIHRSGLGWGERRRRRRCARTRATATYIHVHICTLRERTIHISYLENSNDRFRENSHHVTPQHYTSRPHGREEKHEHNARCCFLPLYCFLLSSSSSFSSFSFSCSSSPSHFLPRVSTHSVFTSPFVVRSSSSFSSSSSSFSSLLFALHRAHCHTRPRALSRDTAPTRHFACKIAESLSRFFLVSPVPLRFLQESAE